MMDPGLAFMVDSVCVWNNKIREFHNLRSKVVVLQPYQEQQLGTVFSIRNEKAKDNKNALRLGDMAPVDSFCKLTLLTSTEDKMNFMIKGDMTECENGEFTPISSTILMKFDLKHGNRFLKNVEILIEEGRLPPMERSQAEGGREKDSAGKGGPGGGADNGGADNGGAGKSGAGKGGPIADNPKPELWRPGF